MRGRYEGMWNVLRFNWPKYAWGVVVLFLLIIGAISLPDAWIWFCLAASLVAVMLVLPLFASHIIYDRSELYAMPWLQPLNVQPPANVLNLTAGFDESSHLIKDRFPACVLHVVDLFSEVRCTEPSIVRARKRYPSFPGTRPMNGSTLPPLDASVDLAVAFLALHELRSHADRVAILKEIVRTLSDTGRLVVTEHLRDPINALVFSVGVFHFLSRQQWLSAFADAGLRVERTYKTTAFITTFVLCRS